MTLKETMRKVKLLISLDYELFFGERSGSVERSLIEPADALAKCVERTGHRLSLFVDAGFLVRARQESPVSARARADYDTVAFQLERLAARGHDLQLHIHPHWQDTREHDGAWRMNTNRYRLQDFDAASVAAIVRDYKAEVELVKQAPVFAYRAGGWCIQPFAAIAGALERENVWIDSTIYSGGRSAIPGREYDFRTAPVGGQTWRFDADPLVPASDGFFLEVPISACRYGTSAFWTIAWRRFTSSADDRPFGDGDLMRASSRYYARRLIAPTWSPVSIDGAKAGFLPGIFARFLQRSKRDDLFNVMGHPKALTPRGLSRLGEFLESSASVTTPVTYRDFALRAEPHSTSSAVGGSGGARPRCS